MPRKRRGKAESLEVVTRDCAGIDIGKDTHYVAVDPDRSPEPVRSFDAFTPDLEEMAAWLSCCGVETVAMESTSVYWIPVYEVLDRASFEVLLVPPRMTKQISGRKSDVLDCQWIRQLLSYGLLRGAFRPGDDVCPLRSYVRQAKRLTDNRSRCVLHCQKALTEMNVRLDSVITYITGMTGQRILRAIIDGERDPRRLAALRDGRIKASGDRIAAALQGTWREEHLFALTQAMQRFDFLTEQIETCERAIAAQMDSLTPPDDGPDDDQPPGSPDSSRSRTCLPKASRSNHAKRTAKESDGRGLAQDDGRRPHRDPDHRSEHRAHHRGRDRPGLLGLPVSAALQLVAGAGAGNADQRRQDPAGTCAQGGQQGRAIPAHGGLDGPKEPDVHRGQASWAPRPEGCAGGDHGNRA